MSEAVFWRCTPRKLLALWDVHKKVNGLDKMSGNDQPEEVFIDELGW